MYTREIQPPRDSPVEDGKPVAGTWNKAFAQVDLLEIRRPYSWPLPAWMRDYRIKEWENFSVQDDRFLLEAFLGNLKMYQVVHVLLYDKESGENYIFRKVLAGNSWKLPRNLGNAWVECRSSGFFLRIHTWLIADAVKLDIDIAAAKKQPALTAHLAFSTGSREATPMAVSLNFTSKRNMYAYKTFTPVRGDIVLGGKHFDLNPARCSGIFSDYKGFFPYRMQGVYCSSMGFTSESGSEESKRYGFHIVENQAKDTRKNNENALWVNKILTPLPPVKITMPSGPESDWIIQDLDGMVDLVFTPRVMNRIGINFLVMSGDFIAPMGYYNGMLVNSKEEQINIKNQWGMGKKLYLRV